MIIKYISESLESFSQASPSRPRVCTGAGARDHPEILSILSKQ